MECREVKKLIRDAGSGELASNAGLLAHIKACGSCSVKYGFILKMSRAAAMKESMRLPAGFEDKVWDRIGEPIPSILSSLRNSFLRKWAYAAVAAAAVVICFTVILKNGRPANNAGELAVKPPATAPAVAAVVKNGITNITEDVQAGQKTGAPAVLAENNTPLQKDVAGVPTAVIEAPKEAIYPKTAAGAYAGAAQAPAAIAPPAGNGPGQVKYASVEEELTATFKKEDEIRGDIAVFNNIFHPLKGEVVTIKYRVKDAGKVIVIVYDRKGKVIKRIYSGDRAAGIYTETWNGKDENGITAANGVYIIYIKAGSLESKVKTAIIK